MIKKFRLDEKLWHKLATINYNGIIFNFKTQETCYSTNYSLHIELVFVLALKLKLTNFAKKSLNFDIFYIKKCVKLKCQK